MDNYEFEEFNAVGGRIIPTINLNGNGFGVSAGFAKKYDLSKVIGVKLFYDKTKNAVGFKFLEIAENGMLKVKLAPNQGGGYINSKAFLIKYEIDAKKFQGRYDAEELASEIGKMFVIKLKENSSE